MSSFDQFTERFIGCETKPQNVSINFQLVQHSLYLVGLNTQYDIY